MRAKPWGDAARPPKIIMTADGARIEITEEAIRTGNALISAAFDDFIPCGCFDDLVEEVFEAMASRCRGPSSTRATRK
jgi:hypothetical protein